MVNSLFSTYFQLGISHITDFEGFDHMLFLLALCGIYLLKDYQTILILVTGFTFGHSITLALAGLSMVEVNAEVIEFLIPVTIFITAVFQIPFLIKEKTIPIKLKLLLTTIFGLIHGLGFSSFFKSILGQTNEMLLVLLAFNIGIEVGQLLIVAAILLLITLANLMFKIKFKVVQIALMAMVSTISVYLMIQTKFW